VISQQNFNESTSQKRRKMTSRLKEKLWLSGRRAGKVRRPARELPFSLDEFRKWAMKHVGMGMVRCHYCPRPIDVLTFEPDHYMPLELGGGLGLDNLVPCCEDCNRLKGAMPPNDFIELMQFLDTRISAIGRADMTKRLRAGAMGIRMRNFPGDRKPVKFTPVERTKEMDFF
jgi:5-methylcytosine-specific restriction endonuclease McrA